MQKLKQLLQFKASTVDEDKFTIEGIFSTNTEDLHGDIVEQNFDLKDFKKNPVILNSHDHFDAASVIGKATKISVKEGKLQGKIKFAVEENPVAKVIFDLYKGGFLNAFSVGFMALEFDKDFKILKSKLLEISAVSVPANPQALAKIAEKGINLEILYEKSNNSKNKSDEENNGEGNTPEGDGGEANGEKDNEENGGNGGGEDGGENKDKEKKLETKTNFDQSWDEDGSNIRLKIRDIGMFDEGSFGKVTIKNQTPKVRAIIAVMNEEDVKKIQMVIFDKNEGWTLDDAKKYFSVNQEKILNWTNAVEEKKVEKKVKIDKKTKREKLLNITLRAIDGLANESVEAQSKTEKAREKSKIRRAVKSLLSEKSKHKKI